jgi:predicted GIY-YIG superfamily endonuclease
MSTPRWHVYLVRCGDGTLYTGVATDVTRRLEEHRRGEGKGAKYLRGRGPLQLVLEKTVGARGVALSVESRIKKLRRAQKEELITRAGKIDEMIVQISGED